MFQCFMFSCVTKKCILKVLQKLACQNVHLQGYIVFKRHDLCMNIGFDKKEYVKQFFWQHILLNSLLSFFWQMQHILKKQNSNDERDIGYVNSRLSIMKLKMIKFLISIDLGTYICTVLSKEVHLRPQVSSPLLYSYDQDKHHVLFFCFFSAICHQIIIKKYLSHKLSTLKLLELWFACLK